jgi:hypothetical protein
MFKYANKPAMEFGKNKTGENTFKCVFSPVLLRKQCMNYFVFFCPLVLGFLYFSFMASGRLTFIFTFRFLPFFS